MTQLLNYADIRLLDIHSDNPENWQTSDATHIRVQMPSTTQNQLEMFNKGFFLADRTIGVQINLINAKTDFSKLVRMNVYESINYKKDVLRIAKESFPEDRRFHITPYPNPELAELIINAWVEDADNYLICMYKDLPVGFLILKQTANDSQFIYLAAVEKKYRATGAAMSLYAKAADICKRKGYRFLEGRISTRNMAVMNLYAYLGGKFANPEDIYLKELISNAD